MFVNAHALSLISMHPFIPFDREKEAKRINTTVFENKHEKIAMKF